MYKQNNLFYILQIDIIKKYDLDQGNIQNEILIGLPVSSTYIHYVHFPLVETYMNHKLIRFSNVFLSGSDKASRSKLKKEKEEKLKKEMGKRGLSKSWLKG